MRITKKLKCAIFVCVLSVCLGWTWPAAYKTAPPGKHGDVTTEVRQWRSRAERGDATAQYVMGFMFAKGRGVKQSYVESTFWLNKAAEQGYPSAQHYLGLMYLTGRGVSKDRVRAHMWLTLAAHCLPPGRDRGAAAAVRDAMAREGPYAQIAKGQRRAREWSERHGQNRYCKLGGSTETREFPRRGVTP